MKALAFESDNFARITTCSVYGLFISAGRGNSLKDSVTLIIPFI